MFVNCYNLVGGGGTSYKDQYKLKEDYADSNVYAIIDNPAAEKYGYYTAKTSELNKQHSRSDACVDVCGMVSYSNKLSQENTPHIESGLDVVFNYVFDGKQMSLTVQTDENGYFCFANIPVGSVGTIEFNSNGFVGKVENITVPKEGVQNIIIVAEQTQQLENSNSGNLKAMLLAKRMSQITI